jgi:polo-like kinase 1
MPDAGSNGIVQKPLSSTQRLSGTVTNTLEPGKDTKDQNNKIFTERNKLQGYSSNTNRPDTQSGDTNRPLTTNYMSNKGTLQSNILKDSTKNLTNGTSTTDKRGKTSSGVYLNTNGNNNLSNTNNTTNLQGADIWVKKWVDYSSKYGLGYLLSNGFTGVFFNDSSKIILNPTGWTFNYIERRQSDKQEIISAHTLTDYPKELQKKVTLLQHFRSYLEGDTQSIGADPKTTIPVSSSISTNPTTTSNINIGDTTDKGGDDKKTFNFVYVKKWMRTKHAIMFRLSNKIVQVCFQDHTEIILSSESRVVTYVNKKGERLTYPLSNALESNNSEMTKRLKYTKDILTHMLNLNQGTSGTGGVTTSTQRNSNINPLSTNEPTSDK